MIVLIGEYREWFKSID